MATNCPEKVYLAGNIIQQLLEHAFSSPEVEVCGLLSGCKDSAVSVYPVDNIAQDEAHQFLLDPAQQIDAMRTMRGKGEKLWGIYHSHPDGPASPSVMDKQKAAYPYIFYFIVSLADINPDIKCFYFDGENFTAVNINSPDNI